MPEMAGHRRRQMRPRAFGVQVHDADIFELGCSGDEGVEEHRWRRGGAVDLQLLA
jgi:hypothetical protein